MREVPEEVKEKTQQLFGSDVYFEWNEVLERFLCKEILNPMEPQYTKTIFVVQAPDGSFREINDQDYHRLMDAKVGTSSEKEERMKKINELAEKERKDKLAADKKRREAKTAITEDLAKRLDSNPNLARAFKAEANARYGGDIVETAKGGKVVVKKNKQAPKKAVKK